MKAHFLLILSSHAPQKGVKRKAVAVALRKNTKVASISYSDKRTKSSYMFYVKRTVEID